MVILLKRGRWSLAGTLFTIQAASYICIPLLLTSSQIYKYLSPSYVEQVSEASLGVAILSTIRSILRSVPALTNLLLSFTRMLKIRNEFVVISRGKVVGFSCIWLGTMATVLSHRSIWGYGGTRTYLPLGHIILTNYNTTGSSLLRPDVAFLMSILSLTTVSSLLCSVYSIYLLVKKPALTENWDRLKKACRTLFLMNVAELFYIIMLVTLSISFVKSGDEAGRVVYCCLYPEYHHIFWVYPY
eukprot:sb/3468987/